ncbi:MAG: F0F1 ATP synthase subunit epsilon [Saprospiraceae bacterium]|nr:F0F1 ATP synthase subunit epsilon [Saprospiraceae bacterium]
MKISMLTPEREIFNGEVASVKVPGSKGEFQVLKNHAPIVSSLEPGVIKIVTAQGEYSYFDEESGQIKTAQDAGKALQFKISGGFVEVLNNQISLLVQGVKEKID